MKCNLSFTSGCTQCSTEGDMHSEGVETPEHCQVGRCSLHYEYVCVAQHLSGLPCGLVVRIPGFHPGGPGSIPGMGNLFALFVHHSLSPLSTAIPPPHPPLSFSLLLALLLFFFRLLDVLHRSLRLTMVFEYCDQVGSNVYSVRFYELIFTVCMSFC